MKFLKFITEPKISFTHIFFIGMAYGAVRSEDWFAAFSLLIIGAMVSEYAKDAADKA
jgi:hypothetical protein